MPLEIRERELPGAGVKYEVDLSADESVAVLIHTSGRRTLYYRDHPDADYEPVIELSDSQARALGLLLVGAYYQPVPTQLGEITPTDERIKWHQLGEDHDAVGRSIGEIDAESKTDAAILAVTRDGERTANPEGSFVLEANDDLAAIGTQKAHEALGALLREGSS